MDWLEAKRQIENKILVGMDVNSEESKQRKILKTEHSCNGYDYNEETGFLVSIGKEEDLEIPWSMLENCFPALHTPEGYNTRCFRKNTPFKQIKERVIRVMFMLSVRSLKSQV